MFRELKINEHSIVPKYEQIVQSIIIMLEKGQLKKGDVLPSLNTTYKKLGVSRDTLITAYKSLQDMGIVGSRHGKGFFISSTDTHRKTRIFLLFDVMNSYKEVLYRSFINSLDDSFQVDIYFHYYNRAVFEKLIVDNLDIYDFYVIMPHFNEDVSHVVFQIPFNKLVIIDNEIKSKLSGYASIHQNFENDIYNSFQKNESLLKKYNKFFFVANNTFQFIPKKIIIGFNKFCKDYGFDSELVPEILPKIIQKSALYIVFNDRDLAKILSELKHKKLILGKDIGVISYDDTPLKEVLENGITVASTNFVAMGEIAASFIKGVTFKKVENKFELILRCSL